MKPVFLSGNLGLDLANTTVAPRRGDGEYDLLATAEALDAWLVEGGVLSEAPGCSLHDLDAARELREAIRTLAERRIDGRMMHPAAAVVVNDMAANPPVVGVLTRAGLRKEGDAKAALSTVARAAQDLFGVQPDAVVKRCGSDTCARVYVDASRGSRRTWCGMAGCGDRVKAANYRARKRAATRVPPKKGAPKKTPARKASANRV